MTTYPIYSPIENWVQRGTKYGLKERGTILLAFWSIVLQPPKLNTHTKSFFFWNKFIKKEIPSGEKKI
jgi:hypothetical protein